MTEQPLMPTELYTARLWLRRWERDDASVLLPILEQNIEHLRPWIPDRVYTPVPRVELEERLSGYDADFSAGVAWRYAMIAAHTKQLLGEVSVFPRSSGGRVSVASADRVEIGYWLRSDATGQGYATEAVQSLLMAVERLPGVRSVEIHCDARNRASAAVPHRLGFELLEREPAASGMVWFRALVDPR